MAVRTRLSLVFQKPFSLFRNQRYAHTEAVANVTAYPAVLPSLTAKSSAAQGRRVEETIKKIDSADVQDKLNYLTRIEREKFVIYPQTFARNADKWYQHFTKTVYIPGLPEKFSVDAGPELRLHGIDDAAFAALRTLVTHAILQEHWYTKKRRVFLSRHQELVVGPYLRNLVSGLTHSMAKYNPLLMRASLDLNPQVNFYWRNGQRIIPRGHRRGHREPTRFQIDDLPHSQIRVMEQLPQFCPMEVSYDAEVPEIAAAPNTMPLFKRQYKNNIFTGSKLPDPACYGHTQFHLIPDRYHRDRMARQDKSDQIEVFIRANGIASLFAWTGAQATYQGFWDRSDVNRPFTSQAVITDGRYFSFFCYQLNTVALSHEMNSKSPRKNLMWGTESLQLFETVQDGQVVGLNDDVLRLLALFLLNRH
ncbi:39S ribosomal protein S30, mitochondrial [Synchiropus splendidus]|uniref:39S ribosomal protein S30, mitochondrial n=1 Tax=Synchiropus splendidus TaxID=270530 RepID=UPI00237EB456|nr:39S ribosomal protein S30, mitochondrial [Synchiropus splendidus]